MDSQGGRVSPLPRHWVHSREHSSPPLGDSAKLSTVLCLIFPNCNMGTAALPALAMYGVHIELQLHPASVSPATLPSLEGKQLWGAPQEGTGPQSL